MTTTYLINDMTCGHCVARVTQAVKGVDPDATVQIDLASHTARVEGADDPIAIAQAIRAAGYTPVQLPA